MLTCQNCGEPARTYARYCLKCGSKLIFGPAPLLQQGHTLRDGRYVIRRLLGQGGMGAVYQAADAQTQKWCAVKQMQDILINDPVQRQEALIAFDREATMLQQLYHVGIPEFYDHFSEGNAHYIVMEYIDGHDLEEVLALNGGQLPEEQVVRYAMQICDVLVYLHGHRPVPIIYRDLKPANVILAADGRRIVLTDFGIARFFAPTFTTGTRIGTPGYAPPEQHQGRVEPRSDLYALAAAMHHLLTGRDPQSDPFNFPRVSQLVPGISVWLDEIIAINLRQEPSERYDSATQLKEDLKHGRVTKTFVCRFCGHSSAHDKGYCDNCSRALSAETVACPQCSTPNALNSRFCIACGAPLTRRRA